MIRVACSSDGAACAAIYAPYVTDHPVSFEAAPPAALEMSARLAECLSVYPWLVWDEDGVRGFAYASQHRTRAAYRWSVDVAIYVSERARRRGIACALYAALIDILRIQGFQSAFAGIALPNEPSLRFHETLGFSPVGVYRNAGFKLGEWRDVAWWQLAFGDLPQAPAEPRPFADLAPEEIAALLTRHRAPA
jgi:phosphinothricin acetyltransferase